MQHLIMGVERTRKMQNDFMVYASLLSATSADASNIASWLADREAAKEAMKMDVDETVQDGLLMATSSEVYDENIAVAQIRILSKRYTTEPDVIPYVAVVDKWDEDMWLIVPFSPYRTPATPGEMETGMDAHGLHVLQAWNGRTVQESILKKSYLFGELPERVRYEALILFRHEFGGVPIPVEFTARLGSPIVEASDPRREYQDECIERLRPLAEAVIEMAERPFVGRIEELFDKYLRPEEEYSLAAATDDFNPHVPVLMYKGAWDAMKEGQEVSGFSGFSAIDGGQTGLVFYLCDKLPQEFDGASELAVAAYKRRTKELVGRGQLVRLEDGRCRISIRLGEDCEPVDVQEAGELVLVVERKDGE